MRPCRPRVTVLYEDSMAVGAEGQFPLHDLVLRMLEDDIDGETWQLHHAIDKNPRNGVDKLLGDLAHASLIAQDGRLCVLVDRDRSGRTSASRRMPRTNSCNERSGRLPMMARRSTCSFSSQTWKGSCAPSRHASPTSPPRRRSSARSRGRSTIAIASWWRRAVWPAGPFDIASVNGSPGSMAS